jgi:hypothetical protein
MKKSRTERLEAWYNGEIEDDELSMKDIRELEERVFAAIAAKTLQRDDVHTFADHRTLQ